MYCQLHLQLFPQNRTSKTTHLIFITILNVYFIIVSFTDVQLLNSIALALYSNKKSQPIPSLSNVLWTFFCEKLSTIVSNVSAINTKAFKTHSEFNSESMLKRTYYIFDCYVPHLTPILFRFECVCFILFV